MKIAVCVKQVPDTETRIRIAPDGRGIVESDLNWIVSPYDEFAIEEALRIKEAKGGEVVLVSLGPDRVQSALRSGLAMGADSALHLKDPLFDQADTLATAWALATALKPLAADLILMGQQGARPHHGSHRSEASPAVLLQDKRSGSVIRFSALCAMSMNDTAPPMNTDSQISRS